MDVNSHSKIQAQKKPTQKNVLFVHYGDDWIRGSEICLINLITTLPSYFRAIVWTNNSSLHTKMQALGITSYYASFSLLFGWNKPKHDVRRWLSLINQTSCLIDKEDIDLIHINSAAPCQWVSLAAMYKNIPFLTQLHSAYVARDRLTLLLHLNPRLICVSHAVGEKIREDGYPHLSLHTIHNGVPTACYDKEAFSVREALSLTDDHPILISVGSLIYRKGMDRLINAVAIRVQSGKPCHLIIIGDGSARDELEALIIEKGLSQYIHLVGEKANVNQWLAGGVDAFVSGARSEAFGLVLVEAMQANIPIIAPSVGGIPEVITDKVTGLLYPSDQDADHHIAAMLDQLFSMNTENLIRHARIQANEHFSITNNTQKICEIYDVILTEPEPQLSLLTLFRVLRPLKSIVRSFLQRTFNALPEKGANHDF